MRWSGLNVVSLMVVGVCWRAIVGERLDDCFCANVGLGGGEVVFVVEESSVSEQVRMWKRQ